MDVDMNATITIVSLSKGEVLKATYISSKARRKKIARDSSKSAQSTSIERPQSYFRPQDLSVKGHRYESQASVVKKKDRRGLNKAVGFWGSYREGNHNQ